MKLTTADMFPRQVVYVTVFFPYVLLIIFLIKGLTLDGAMDGVRYFIKPDVTKLLEIRVSQGILLNLSKLKK